MAKTTKKRTSSKSKAASSKIKALVEVRFTKPPSAEFKIAAEIGKVKAFTPNQAKELVETGYAEYVN